MTATEGLGIDLQSANLRCLDVADISAGRLAARNALAIFQDGGERILSFSEDTNIVRSAGEQQSVLLAAGRLFSVLAQVSPAFIPEKDIVAYLGDTFSLKENSAYQACRMGLRLLNEALNDDFVQSTRAGRISRIRLNPGYFLQPMSTLLPSIDPYEASDISLELDGVVISNQKQSHTGRNGGKKPQAQKPPRTSKFPREPRYRQPGPDDVVDSDNWMEFSRCAEVDPSLFFPSDGGEVEDAKRFCADCDVKEHCLDYALSSGQDHGVWGGTSERERRRILKARAAADLRARY